MSLKLIFCLVACFLSAQVAWVEAVNSNDSVTCWSMGEANIKPFNVINMGFATFNGIEGYYTMMDNSKLTVVAGFRILNDVPINCAVYVTNKETSATVFIDFCPFSMKNAYQLSGYISNGTDVATNCSYLIAIYNVTKDVEWLNRVPAQTSALSAGFKCASVVPSPYLDSIAIRTTLSNSDEDIVILIDSMNNYYMQKIYIYNANTADNDTTGICTLGQMPTTVAGLNKYIASFPLTNGTLLSPSLSSEASTTRMNAITMCRDVFVNNTNWTQLTTNRSLNFKVLIMLCTNDYQENGDETILTNMYSHFFINELVHQTFYDSTYYNGDTFSDTGYQFFTLLCNRFCPTSFNFTCQNNTECEGELCDSPVECVSQTGYVFETKSSPILVTSGPVTKNNTSSESEETISIFQIGNFEPISLDDTTTVKAPTKGG